MSWSSILQGLYLDLTTVAWSDRSCLFLEHLIKILFSVLIISLIIYQVKMQNFGDIGLVSDTETYRGIHDYFWQFMTSVANSVLWLDFSLCCVCLYIAINMLPICFCSITWWTDTVGLVRVFYCVQKRWRHYTNTWRCSFVNVSVVVMGKNRWYLSCSPGPL